MSSQRIIIDEEQKLLSTISISSSFSTKRRTLLSHRRRILVTWACASAALTISRNATAGSAIAGGAIFTVLIVGLSFLVSAITNATHRRGDDVDDQEWPCGSMLQFYIAENNADNGTDATVVSSLTCFFEKEGHSNKAGCGDDDDDAAVVRKNSNRNKTKLTSKKKAENADDNADDNGTVVSSLTCNDFVDFEDDSDDDDDDIRGERNEAVNCEVPNENEAVAVSAAAAVLPNNLCCDPAVIRTSKAVRDKPKLKRTKKKRPTAVAGFSFTTIEENGRKKRRRKKKIMNSCRRRLFCTTGDY